MMKVPMATWRWTFGAAAVALAGTVAVLAAPAIRQGAVLWSVSLEGIARRREGRR